MVIEMVDLRGDGGLPNAADSKGSVVEVMKCLVKNSSFMLMSRVMGMPDFPVSWRASLHSSLSLLMFRVLELMLATMAGISFPLLIRLGTVM